MRPLTAVNDRLAGLGGAKWAVHLEGKRRAAAGTALTFLSIGEPDLPPPVRVVDEAVRSLRAGRTGYAGGQGEPVARAAVAGHVSRRSGLAVNADQVVAFAGTQNGLYATLTMLVQDGDEVLVPDPYYATYEGVVAATGAAFVPVRTEPETGFHLTAAGLEAVITPRSRLLLLNTPSNPTGAVLTADDIDAIGQVCIRHDLWIVCDEVYADLTFGTPFASPFDRPRLRERSFSVASISKSHALPGFRTGWVVCPPGLAAPLTVLAEAMLFGSQPFLADALAVALDEHHPEVDELRATFEQRARALVAAFDGSTAARATMPEGGMFVLVDIRETGLTGEQFAWRLLDECGVVVMPGESFGAGGAGQLRVALTVEADVLVDACGKIRSLAESLFAAAR